jgi:AraC-like DNA-binding protein
VTLARVASEYGYTDQAHMTREFRALARTTPAFYAAASQPGFLGVPEERVNFVQDRSG